LFLFRKTFPIFGRTILLDMFLLIFAKTHMIQIIPDVVVDFQEVVHKVLDVFLLIFAN
jgi:hypothetical protein